jgi:hypothetical protein
MPSRKDGRRTVITSAGRGEIESPQEFIRENVKAQGGDDSSAVLCSYCGGFETIHSDNLTIVQITIPDEEEYAFYPTEMIDHNRMALVICHAHHFPITHKWDEDVYIPPPQWARLIVEGEW